jgi:hypothetical protein
LCINRGKKENIMAQDLDQDLLKEQIAGIVGHMDHLRKGAKPGQNLAAIQAIVDETLDCVISIFHASTMPAPMVAHYAIPVFDDLLLYRQDRFAEIVTAVVIAYRHTPMPRVITARVRTWHAFIRGQKVRAEAAIETVVMPPAIAAGSTEEKGDVTDDIEPDTSAASNHEKPRWPARRLTRAEKIAAAEADALAAKPNVKSAAKPRAKQADAKPLADEAVDSDTRVLEPA